MSFFLLKKGPRGTQPQPASCSNPHPPFCWKTGKILMAFFPLVKPQKLDQTYLFSAQPSYPPPEVQSSAMMSHVFPHLNWHMSLIWCSCFLFQFSFKRTWFCNVSDPVALTSPHGVFFPISDLSSQLIAACKWPYILNVLVTDFFPLPS